MKNNLIQRRNLLKILSMRDSAQKYPDIRKNSLQDHPQEENKALLKILRIIFTDNF